MLKPCSARIVFLLFALVAADSAWAHRDHGHRGAHIELFVGVPLASPWYSFRTYPRPYYYYYQQPLIVVPSATAATESPPVYIEQSEQQPADREVRPDLWWYYCPSQGAYYPYTKTCPHGWQRVAPQLADLH